MKRMLINRRIRLQTGQPGFTLVELLIAMAIALFLVGGVLTLLDGTRRTFGSQNQLAQLQDNQRLAMTLITDVIQSAGYFPNPTVYTASSALPSLGPFAIGQPITGTYSGASPWDVIAVRYLTANNDGIINCQGGSNTSGGPQMFINRFSIDFAVDPKGQLVCSLNGTPAVPLVTGVNKLVILYGVKTDFSQDNGTPDSYLNASQMTAANWGNIISVKVTLSFVNPLAGSSNQPATIDFTRVIGVMARAGVKS